MSRLWPERILVSLEPAALAWVRRGARGHVPADPAYGPEPWHGALEALRGQAAAWRVARARVGVVLSNSFVRYLIVPAGRGAASTAEEAALARFHFTRVHGERAQAWEARLAPGRGAARLACAIDRALLAGLRACFSAGARARLVSVQPHLVSAYNRWRARIPRDGAWLVLAEAGHVCFAAVDGGGWQVLASERGREGWLERLERERLRATGRALPRTVLVRAEGGADLLPLDDAPELARLAA